LSYIIVDLDGTLILENEQPNQPLIDHLNAQVMEGDAQLIVVSARKIDRLTATRAWLQEYGVAGVDEIHLNDFEGTAFATGLAFKEYKYGLLATEYGSEIEYAIDNDPDVRAMARGLGIEALSPEEALRDEERAIVQVPAYVAAAATAGLEAYEGGLAGEGLQDQTVREARQLAAGSIDDEKVARMGAWIRRHRGDWEGVPQNSDPEHPDFPAPGAVAALLWGVNPVDTNGADRVLAWADRITAEALQKESNAMAREHEMRALPLGEFSVSETEDGQKTFSGYAAVFNAESQGLPFIERIAKGAFSRAIKQAEQGRRVIKFLHGHDESRMLATTASGRLSLTEDEVGLKVEARLDPADPDAAAVISKLQNESKAMGMSFGFTVPKNGQQWHEDGSRTLTEIGLLEVSTLSGHQPAYPATLGLTAVRKIAPARIGVDGDALLETLEAVKAGTSLDVDQTALLDAVRARLGAAAEPEAIESEPAPMGEHHTVVAARLKLEQLKG
jgi:HK97 family phage prohead protease